MDFVQANLQNTNKFVKLLYALKIVTFTRPFVVTIMARAVFVIFAGNSGEGKFYSVKECSKILICDDDVIVLEALQEQLEAGLSLWKQDIAVRTFSTVTLALLALETFMPDLIVMDLHIAGQDFAGIEALLVLAKQYPSIRRVAVTAHGANIPDSAFRRLQSCMLDGFIDKKRGVRGVLDWCYRIWEGNRWFEPEFIARQKALANGVNNQRKALSNREVEVLRLFAQGLTPQEIAQALTVERPTVYSYLNRIQEKLGLKRRADLQAFWRQSGLD